MTGSDGGIYGTTSNGGPNRQMFPAGDGTFFRIAQTGDYTLLGYLGRGPTDASHPVAGLVEAMDGYVYGTTDNGGAFESGAVFRFAIAAGGNEAGAPGPTRSQRRPRRARTALARARKDGRDRRRMTARRMRRACAAAALVAAMCGAHAQPYADMVEYSKAWSLVVADFDRDGRDDILIAGHDQEDRIWYGSPTGYRPGPQSLPWQDRHGCAAADVNRDGLLDFFCAVGAVKGTGKKNNELWRQEPGGVFESVANFGAEDLYGRGRKPVFLDLDHDGWPDLYVTNESTLRHDGQDNVNRMFLNRGDGTFVEVATVATGSSAKPGQPGSECAVRGDVDGDGWDDLLVCNHDGPGHIFINDHSANFVPLMTDALGKGWRDARLVDMDADGRDDLVDITPNHHLQIWVNAGTPPYYVVPALDVELPAEGVSLTTGNFDNDLRQDVYVVLHDECSSGRDGAADVIYRQRTPGHWSLERLRQPFGGCGYTAATIEGSKVLLANGTAKESGPNYVLTFGSK